MKLESANYLLKERLPYLVLSGSVFVCDRVAKWLVQERLRLGEVLTVVEGFFDLTHVRNTGVAFGMFSGAATWVRVALLSGIAAAAAVMVVIYSIRSSARQRGLQVGLALILGGALGNLFDRLSNGYVVDFLDFYIWTYTWPTFNVADTAISVGVGLLILEMIRDEIRSGN